MEEVADGDYVRFRDAQAEVADMAQTIKLLRDELTACQLERDALRTEMLEVNKALGLDRDNQDNALRVKTALRLRLPEAPK